MKCVSVMVKETSGKSKSKMLKRERERASHSQIAICWKEKECIREEKRKCLFSKSHTILQRCRDLEIEIIEYRESFFLYNIWFREYISQSLLLLNCLINSWMEEPLPRHCETYTEFHTKYQILLCQFATLSTYFSILCGIPS